MKINELLQLAWDVLCFRTDAYAQHVARADTLKRGLTLLVLVTLVAGLLGFLINTVQNLRSIDPAVQRQEAQVAIREFTSAIATLQSYLDLPPGFMARIIRYMQSGIDIGLRINALPTPFPKPVGRFLENLGTFLSLPFNRIAGWLGYTLWVLLVAKLLGGRATVTQMLGATALYAVPHVLDILGMVRCLGGLLGLIGTLWGIAIYVKAVSIANDIDIGQAILATVTPAVVGILLSGLGLFTLVILVVIGG
ncbi:MAG TPA: hypothetical protein ENN99_13185 [Chloroflexi bacterium]|mgnify:CR=1 FL=1|nr:hypothetical protein [Chloroflexota bacterium]